MDKEVFLKWLGINGLFLLGTFAVAFLVARSFPDAALGFVRSWGGIGNVAFSRIIEPRTEWALFAQILLRNGVAVSGSFFIGLLLFSPLYMVVTGTFYSLGLLSAIDRGVEPIWHPPILITLEALLLIIATTFASTLASGTFGIEPERKPLTTHYKKV